MSNAIPFIVITIGSIFSIIGVIFFFKGIGKNDYSKIKFLNIEFESKSSSLIVFIVGAALIWGTIYSSQKEISPKNVIDITMQMDSIGTTGWVFLGYYDFQVNKFTEGPFYAIFKSSYKLYPDSININKGDILIILKKRNVIIVGYSENKTKGYLNPPLVDLTDGDKTGVVLPIGTKVIVEDISITQYPNSPFAVWARIRLE